MVRDTGNTKEAKAGKVGFSYCLPFSMIIDSRRSRKGSITHYSSPLTQTGSSWTAAVLNLLNSPEGREICQRLPCTHFVILTEIVVPAVGMGKALFCLI